MKLSAPSPRRPVCVVVRGGNTTYGQRNVDNEIHLPWKFVRVNVCVIVHGEDVIYEKED